MRRSKKDRLPAGADEGDRAKFAKLRDYLLRLDDEVTCKTCGKKFEIPSQHSLMFVDQLAGLPNEEELEREISDASGEPEPRTREQAGAAGAVHAQVERLEVERGDASLRYSVGTTNMFSSVDVVSPHRITMAIGV